MRSWLVAILVAMLASCSSGAVLAQNVPPLALVYLPVLVEKQRAIWPDAPIPSFLASQVEQESCLSLTHSKCWNPRSELKTSRENGIGLGQFTRAFKADGSIRFDKISELAAAHKSLREWTWERRYEPGFQLTALVEMNKSIYRRVLNAATTTDRLSFTLSAYNGGVGGVLQDRRLCGNTAKCDPNRWTGHVARTSLKSKIPHPGYRQSFYAINREYVSNVLTLRRPKYDRFFKD